MNDYFLLRIKLQDLDSRNDKTEYRELYRCLSEKGFRDFYFDQYDNELMLPEGMYAIMRFDYTSSGVLTSAEEAIRKALESYYPSSWEDKYTLVVTGPAPILNKNLEPTE